MEEHQAKESARERMFDALLTDAVHAEASASSAPARERNRYAQLAAVLLGVIVLVCVTSLQMGAEHAAQDRVPFDPLFPRMDRELHRGPLETQLHSLARAQALPRGKLPPLSVLADDQATRIAILEELADRPGVRSLVIGGQEELPATTWQLVGRMPNLETLCIGCVVEAANVRELRHAPELRLIQFGKGRFELTEEMLLALVELPHLDALQFVWQKLPPETFAILASLPHLHMLYLESCTLADGWLTELRKLRVLRWLSVHFGPYKKGTLTSEEVKRFSDIRQLQSLRLANVEIEEAGFDALPSSLRVLEFSDGVPESALRTLLTRPQLRGFGFDRLDAATDKLLCELLPKTNLERFGCSRSPSEDLWRVLSELPRLRHLRTSGTSDREIQAARWSALKHLEHLEWYVRELPTPEQLQPLKNLASLRRIAIRDISGSGRTDRRDVEALRRVFGANVEVIVR